MFIHLLILFSISPRVAHCLHNVTVYSSDPSITYTPPTGSWISSVNNSLDAGNFHKLTQDTTATANFTFNGCSISVVLWSLHVLILEKFSLSSGIAIYYMSPRWPYLVNTAVSLDYEPPILLDLEDHSQPNVGQGPETIQSQVIWNAGGLTNTQHSLLISVGTGQPYAVVDALMYYLACFLIRYTMAN